VERAPRDQYPDHDRKVITANVQQFVFAPRYRTPDLGPTRTLLAPYCDGGQLGMRFPAIKKRKLFHIRAPPVKCLLVSYDAVIVRKTIGMWSKRKGET
jgi:hypothetical protein